MAACYVDPHERNTLTRGYEYILLVSYDTQAAGLQVQKHQQT